MSIENNPDNSELQQLYDSTGLSSNMEDYLEAISRLSVENRVVRVKDIAKKLDIKMPSVTAALNRLREMEFIEYEKYGFIELTEKGKKISAQIYNKHKQLSDFFHNVLQLDPAAAEQEACKVEHALTPETCVQLHKFMQFIKSAETEKESWYSDLRSALEKT
ncbi:MAG: metal-dependent transcriptional regulator [Leptospirales bacterium]|nr:metal-dependent transcriptional regulator [Leptospirales bacterium]